MAIDPTLESVVTARRSDLLNKIGNSAQSSQQASKRDATEKLADKVRQRHLDDTNAKKDELPVNPKRGRNVNFNT